jgi:hypothetical protein
MTLFVLLPAAAGAGIVSSDFRLLAADRLHGRIIAANARRLPRRASGRRAGGASVDLAKRRSGL